MAEARSNSATRTKCWVATVISQRTREEQTTAVSERVFARFPDASALAQADEAGLYDLLQGSEYREAKAPRLLAMARILVEKHGGKAPDDIDALLELPGVGRKTANCVLIYAFERGCALCGHPQPSHHEPFGVGPHEDTRRDGESIGAHYAARPMGGQQSPVPATRTRHLSARRPCVQPLSRSGLVCLRPRCRHEETLAAKMYND